MWRIEGMAQIASQKKELLCISTVKLTEMATIQGEMFDKQVVGLIRDTSQPYAQMEFCIWEFLSLSMA